MALWHIFHVVGKHRVTVQRRNTLHSVPIEEWVLLVIPGEPNGALLKGRWGRDLMVDDLIQGPCIFEVQAELLNNLQLG